MFKEGDIIVPSMNNMEAVFEKPVPQYKICQICMGRVLAENIRTGEIVDVGPMKEAGYYYTKVNTKVLGSPGSGKGSSPKTQVERKAEE